MLVFFLLLVAGGLAMGLYFVAQPQDLTDIAGQNPQAVGRDLTVVLRNSAKRNIPVTIQEKELNEWLARKVRGSQSGPLAERLQFERVLVRLREGMAEVIMERKIAGRPFTVSMFLQVRQVESEDGAKTDLLRHGGPYHPAMTRPDRGGRFGRLVVPQGFLILILPAYEKFAAVLGEEIDLGFHEMMRISIKDGRLELDPGGPASR